MTGPFLTETEAQQRWCPLLRAEGGTVRLGATPASNSIAPTDAHRAVRNPSWSTCIGSRCMAWRWAPRRLGNGQLVPAETGYCGLAGGPS
jgi:hypothetical protein